jgi:hypothetical protein
MDVTKLSEELLTLLANSIHDRGIEFFFSAKEGELVGQWIRDFMLNVKKPVSGDHNTGFLSNNLTKE